MRAGLFALAELARSVGAFDERLLLLWEESAWCYGARAAGGSSLVVPPARVWHKVGVRFGSEASLLGACLFAEDERMWISRHGSVGERGRAMFAAVPRCSPSGSGVVGLPRRLLSAGRDRAMSLVGRDERLGHLALRRALLDFATGRLGPPPRVVLELNRRWAERRREADGTAADG